MSASHLNRMTARAKTLLSLHEHVIYRRTDRLFAALMALQWLAGIAAAYWVAPRTWVGPESRANPTVWAAVILGGLVSIFPILLALWKPGRTLTRHIIAIAQLVMSGLLIHFTGGRIETHFHIFGSLAFLAFYRDWPVLITASVVTAADHVFRGYFWPQSVYGVASAQPWRWVEHAGWVVFTDVFLIISIIQSRREMWNIACRQAEVELAEAALQCSNAALIAQEEALRRAHEELEQRVEERTAQLAHAEQMYRSLVESSPETVVVYCQGQLAYVNAAALTLLGAASPEQILGRSVLDFIHPNFHAAVHERMRRSQREGLSSPLTEMLYVRLDGTIIDVEVVTTSIMWNGQPAGQALIRDISERKRAERQIVALNAELMSAYDATIAGWSRALDLRDHETEGHSLRVTEMTLALAKTFGIAGEPLLHIRRGALLHDIGKMGVPDAILNKPGPLTEEERMIMCLHPAYAYEMLAGIPFVHPALDIPYAHHEKWDGTGYPRRLAGEAIPFSARLFAVVDVWDALRSDRPYRRAWSVEKTRAHIAALAGTHFDPQVTEIFLRDIAPAADEAAEVPLLRAA